MGLNCICGSCDIPKGTYILLVVLLQTLVHIQCTFHVECTLSPYTTYIYCRNAPLRCLLSIYSYLVLNKGSCLVYRSNYYQPILLWSPAALILMLCADIWLGITNTTCFIRCSSLLRYSIADYSDLCIWQLCTP